MRSIRLEAATSRLEDIAEAQAEGRAPPAAGATGVSTASQASSVTAPAAPAAPPPPPEDPALIQAYDAQVLPPVETFVKLSGELSPVLKEQVSL